MVMVKFRKKEEPAQPSEGPRSLTPPPKRRRKREGEGGGCRIVLLLFLLCIAVAVAGCYFFRESYTSTEAMPVQVYRVRQAVLEQARQKVQALRQASKINAVVTVALGEAEVNALVQNAAHETGWAGEMLVEIEDTLAVTYSVPLKNIPGFSGRYLNGTATFHLTGKNGELDVEWRKGTLNQRDIPGFLRKRFSGKRLAKRIIRVPRLDDVADHIARLEVADGQLRIITRHVNKVEE